MEASRALADHRNRRRNAARPVRPKSRSAPERRAAEARLRGLVARFAPTHQRLVATLRRRLRSQMPAAHELVYAHRDGGVIGCSPSDRGHEGVFAIRASPDGVRPSVHRGQVLPDPAQRLQGAGRPGARVPERAGPGGGTRARYHRAERSSQPGSLLPRRP